jgi:tetratricopeptide (TPR) repeat protein
VEDSVQDIVQRANVAITAHRIDEAVDLLERALSLDFENPFVVTALKYVNFWHDRHLSMEGYHQPFERGEYLLAQWKTFLEFVRRIEPQYDAAIHALRTHVFRLALSQYREVYGERANRDADLLVRVGRCYKGVGEFDKALRFYQAAGTQRPDDAEILAELADVMALVDEPAKAKAFFREAFFIDPQKIDTDRLESELIRRLIDAVAEVGFRGPVLKEWLPVYGVLRGVLNVKRELRSIEFGRLKQSIYALERELRDGKGDNEIITARLITRYFWLIDHYVATKESQGKIDEVFLRIRSVDANVYQQYAKLTNAR